MTKNSDRVTLTMRSHMKRSDELSAKLKMLWARVKKQGEYDEAYTFYHDQVELGYTDRLKRGQRPRSAKFFAKATALSAAYDKFPEDEEKQEAFHKRSLDRKRNRTMSIAMGYEKARIMKQEKQSDEDRSMMMSRNRYVMGQLRGKPDTTLSEDVEFARKNVHLIGDQLDQETWLVKPREAPSASAWNMLMYAVEDPREFIKIAMRHRREAEDRVHQIRMAELKGGSMSEDGKEADPMRKTVKELLAKMKEEAKEEADDE